VGICIYQKDKRKEALNWYEKSFSNGEILAAARLGTMYKFFFKDVEGAKNWYQKGAEKGDETCQWMLGSIYESEENFENAKFWYQKAAEQGNEEAAAKLQELSK